jgi:hypothetical protein
MVLRTLTYKKNHIEMMLMICFGALICAVTPRVLQCTAQLFFFRDERDEEMIWCMNGCNDFEKYSIGTVGSCVHVLLQFKANRLGMHVHGVYQIIVLYHVAMPIC